MASVNGEEKIRWQKVRERNSIPLVIVALIATNSAIVHVLFIIIGIIANLPNLNFTSIKGHN